jgi:hypothetical protein
MNEDDDLSFSYPLADKSVYELEKKIKSYMRRYSVNIPKEKDIERYSDIYNESVLVDLQSAKKHLIRELLSPELLESLGMEKAGVEGNYETEESFVLDDENENDSLEEDVSSDVDGDYKIGISDNDDSSSNKEDEMVF